MVLPKLSPTIAHWLTLAGSTFLGAVMAAVAQDGGAFAVFTDLADPTKRWSIVGGAIVAGVMAVIALAQRSFFPSVSVKAVTQNAAKAAVLVLCLVFIGATQTACIANAPIVPVTPTNTQQVSTCQNDALEHNSFMLGGLIVGAGSTGLASVAALESSNQGLQTGLAVTAAILAGLATVAGGGAGLTASAFTSSNCSSVVGALPAQASPTGAK